MSKIVLLSQIFAMIALPAICARERTPRRGARKLLIYMLAFDAFYAFALRFLYGRL
jgi:hypothetical protein